MCVCDQTTKNRRVQKMVRGRPSMNNPCAFIQQILPSDPMKVGLSGCIQQLVLLGNTGRLLMESFSSWGFGWVKSRKFSEENEKQFKGLKNNWSLFPWASTKREGWVSYLLNWFEPHTRTGTHTRDLQIPRPASTHSVGPSPLLHLEEQKCRTFW